jgi:hypothetical protein
MSQAHFHHDYHDLPQLTHGDVPGRRLDVRIAPDGAAPSASLPGLRPAIAACATLTTNRRNKPKH